MVIQWIILAAPVALAVFLRSWWPLCGLPVALAYLDLRDLLDNIYQTNAAILKELWRMGPPR